MSSSPGLFPTESVGFVCPQCGARQVAALPSIYDTRESGARARLLAGDAFVASCRECGARARVAAPIFFHDQFSQSAYAFLPPSAATREFEEQLIGKLMNRVLESLPPTERRMYVLQPQRFITEASLLEAVAALAEPPRATVTADHGARQGHLTPPSVEEVIEALEESRAGGQLDDAVGALRPLLDYGFFSALTARIEAGGREAENLLSLRTAVLESVDKVDAALEREVERAVEILTEALRSPDPVSIIQQRASQITPIFFAVASANLEDAEARGDVRLAGMLQALLDAALDAVEEALPARDRLATRLSRANSDSERQALLAGAGDLADAAFAASLREAANEAQGAGATDIAERLEAAAAVLDSRLQMAVAG